MKIVAIIDNAIGAGGGFDQALNAVLQMQRLCMNRYEFETFTTDQRNVDVLAQLGVKAEWFKYSFLDRLFAKCVNSVWYQELQCRLKLIGPLEKKLIARNCDLVYFVTLSDIPQALQHLNYITTVWDLCHRDAPEFPEVRNFNTFFIRENLYRNTFGPAYLVLTDSAALADLASQRYGVDRDRFLPMPYGSSPFILESSSLSEESVLAKYELTPGYFYYPAQFWAHKNHIRILEALCILRDKHLITPTVVFSGKDYGNLAWVEAYISKHKLADQVKILGFVPSIDIRGLYEGAGAVVMPTYFGPTNLPPLEAWTLGTPLIYSSHLAQAQDAALLVDADDAESLADAMRQINAQPVREALIAAGKRQLEVIARKRIEAEDSLSTFLDKFEKRRRLWGGYR